MASTLVLIEVRAKNLDGDWETVALSEFADKANAKRYFVLLKSKRIACRTYVGSPDNWTYDPKLFAAESEESSQVTFAKL